MLRHALRPHAGFGRDDFDFDSNHAQMLIHLMQVLPERQTEIRVALDAPEFKTRFEEGLKKAWGSKSKPEERYRLLAQAAVIYSTDFSTYKARAAEYWPAVQIDLKRLSNASEFAVEMVWAAAVLNAPSAEIDSQGKLDLGQRPALQRSAALPDRLVA